MDVTDNFSIRGSLDYDLIKEYIRDIENRTNFKIGLKQLNELKEALRKNVYGKLTPAQTEAHRKLFTSKVKNELIKQWEAETGQSWPRYTTNIFDQDGDIVRKIGDYYDAHHIIENNYNGDHAWWNITPAKFPDIHQGGIHGSNSPARRLFM